MNESGIKVGDKVTIAFPQVFTVRAKTTEGNLAVTTASNPNVVMIVTQDMARLVVEVPRAEVGVDYAESCGGKTVSKVVIDRDYPSDEPTFKKGDRVRVKLHDGGRKSREFYPDFRGKRGTVLTVDAEGLPVLIEVRFDEGQGLYGGSRVDCGFAYELEHIADAVPQAAELVPLTPVDSDTVEADADCDDDGDDVFDNELEPGDVVVLRSGGPDMTVVEINGDNAVCQWFDRGGDLCQRPFLIDSLDFATVEVDEPAKAIAPEPAKSEPRPHIQAL